MEIKNDNPKLILDQNAVHRFLADARKNIPAILNLDKGRIAADFIRMVSGGHANALLLHGNGGLGKTFLTLKILDSQKSEYVYFSGYSTPLSFYKFLASNNIKNK